MPRKPRDHKAERKAAERAYEQAKEKDTVVGRIVDGEVVFLPPIEDEVLTASERLRAATAQPVAHYIVCPDCKGLGCDTCEHDGWLVTTRELNEKERALVENTTYA